MAAAVPDYSDEAKALFIYRNISELPSGELWIPKDSDTPVFGAHKTDRGVFIKFGYMGSDVPIIDAAAGWKIHIAVDPRSIAPTWDIVKDILIDQRIVQSKVAKEGTTFDETEQGKQITIYQYLNPSLSWDDILAQIETGLSSRQIPRGTFCLCDRPIPGSDYITYRNDSSRSGKYLSQIKARSAASRLGTNAYNPYNFTDPLAELSLKTALTDDATSTVEQTKEAGI